MSAACMYIPDQPGLILFTVRHHTATTRVVAGGAFYITKDKHSSLVHPRAALFERHPSRRRNRETWKNGISKTPRGFLSLRHS